MQFMSCLAEFVNKNKRTEKFFSSCQSELLSVDIEVLLSCYLNCNTEKCQNHEIWKGKTKNNLAISATATTKQNNDFF